MVMFLLIADNLEIISEIFYITQKTIFLREVKYGKNGIPD